MDTQSILEAIAKFLQELGYEDGDAATATPRSLQATIEQLAADLESVPSATRVSQGGLTLGREGDGPLVMSVGFFDVEVERVEGRGRTLLTAINVRQPGVDEGL